MSELGPDTHELLRKARQGTPALPPAVRGRLRGAVMTGAGLSTVAAGISFAKVIVIGVVSASLGSVATMVVTKQQQEQRVAPPAPALTAPPVAGAPVIESATAESLTAISPPAAPPAPSRAEARPAIAAARPSPPAAEVTTVRVVDERSLAAELETLEGILQATDAANWSNARVRLGAYRSRFEDGHFRIEAQALEVLTLCGEHHVDAARALRRELLTVEPLNPAVLRLSTSCAAD